MFALYYSCCYPIIVARAENAVLKKKCEALEQRCRVLTVENETLKAEVEMYRKEHAILKSAQAVAAGVEPLNNYQGDKSDDSKDPFVQCGNGVYAESKEVTLEKLHGISNPSCCALSKDDTLLATGGADQNITLCPWGAALSGAEDAAKNAVEKAARVSCGAPVISVGFDTKSRSQFVAAGCMDGTVHIVQYQNSAGLLEAKEIAAGSRSDATS